MKKLLHLEHIPQTTDYTCGPTSLMSFTKYHNLSTGTEMQMAHKLRTCPNTGTSPQTILSYLQEIDHSSELNTRASYEDLINTLNNDYPALVLWYDGNEMHWSNAVGYHDNDIILLDPYNHDAYTNIDKNIFKTLWSRLMIS